MHRFSSQTFSLHDCFVKFMENEKLDDYTCPKCHGEGQKKQPHDKEMPDGIHTTTNDGSDDVDNSDHNDDDDDGSSNHMYISKGLTKSMSLWRLPPILIVQMKRFKFDRVSYHHRKLNQRIRFPISSSLSSSITSKGVAKGTTAIPYLDMAPYMTSSKMKEYKLVEPGIYKAVHTHSNSNDDILCTSFDLYAVVHHSGALGSGHYVATVKDSNQRDGLWYCYNDDEVGAHVHTYDY